MSGKLGETFLFQDGIEAEEAAGAVGGTILLDQVVTEVALARLVRA